MFGFRAVVGASILCVCAAVAAVGCSSNGPASDSTPVVDTTARHDGAADTAGQDAPLPPVQCTLGTVYPGASVIDPDNPDFAGDGKTKAEVVTMFAQAKASNSRAYQAYKAAFTYPDLVQCAFCSCGCEQLAGHKSAIDCFKDLHGFT